MQKENQIESKIRILLMVTGILLIGLCVSFLRIAGFGVDPLSGMNLAISGFIGWSFGNWQLVINIVLLIIVFFTVRHCIGLGTIINMVFVGYIADFICFLVNDVAQIHITMPLRIIALILGQFMASMGVALYMTADMGVAPYDAVAVIIEKATKGKIPFHIARVSSDITVVIIGVLFCIIGKNSVWSIVGIGTIINACCNGPMIQFFKEKVIKHLIRQK